jgi:Ca-activated chloride channel family protein
MSHHWNRVRSRVVAAVATVCITQGAEAAGLMTPVQGSLDELRIKQHHVSVVIEDGYAVTTVDQTFFNPHQQALEAVYSFPVPTQASVGEFTYWIDGKPVTGEVLEKDRARDLYQQEKAQGRETALTEQDAYRTFDIHVYPVRPQDDVRIRLVYLQPVHLDQGVGRYVYPLEEGGVDEERLAFWTYNEIVDEAFSFDLSLRSSYPVDSFRLPQHPQAVITAQSSQIWAVSLGNGSTAAAMEPAVSGRASPQALKLDQDIVVYWRHQAGLPGSIDMVTHRPESNARGTFMLTMTPGDDLAPIQTGRDWVIVLDCSGSMQGKYQSLVEGVRKGLQRLPNNDRFRIVLFNDRARELSKGYVPASNRNVNTYIKRLEATEPGGGTNLYAGLELGYKHLDADRPSAILLVTDGVANIGVTEKTDFLRLLEQHDVRLFSFVMGNSANRPLLEGMTKVSNGFYTDISNGDDIAGRLIQTAGKLSHEAYRDLELKIDGVRVKDLTPARIGSLYRGQQLTVFGHYWGDGLGKVEIAGKVSGRKVAYQSALDFPRRSELNPELERLWAYATIQDLQNRMDYLGHDSDSEEAITDLAVEYGLVTDYTSMLVVRDEVFDQLGIDRHNAGRVAAEQHARQQRGGSAVRDHRQDTQQPAFSKPRAYPGSGGNGSGSVGPLTLLLLLPLLWASRHSRTGGARAQRAQRGSAFRAEVQA